MTEVIEEILEMCQKGISLIISVEKLLLLFY